MSFIRNFAIEKILKEWKNECHITRPIHYWYNSHTGILTICSSDVGRLIGTYGAQVEKYRNILKEARGISNFKDVEFQEINYHWV